MLFSRPQTGAAVTRNQVSLTANWMAWRVQIGLAELDRLVAAMCSGRAVRRPSTDRAGEWCSTKSFRRCSCRGSRRFPADRIVGKCSLLRVQSVSAVLQLVGLKRRYFSLLFAMAPGLNSNQPTEIGNVMGARLAACIFPVAFITHQR
jgi:hypothetical protein